MQPEMQPETKPQEKPKRERRERGEPRHRSRFLRFMRGYLMIVGAATTVYVIIYLAIKLFVEIDKWIPAVPLS